MAFKPSSLVQVQAEIQPFAKSSMSFWLSLASWDISMHASAVVWPRSYGEQTCQIFDRPTARKHKHQSIWE